MPDRKAYPVEFILRNFEIREDGKVYWRQDNQLRANNGSLYKSPAGSQSGKGRLVVRLKNKAYLVHHIAWILYHKAPLEEGLILRHKDGDERNNRLENLIAISRKEMIRKNPKRNSRNTSGYTGVYWHVSSKLWCAYITVDGEHKPLGYYRDKTAAIAARHRAETQYDFAHQE